MREFAAYKYRLYPTPEQAVIINKNIGCARWVYNWALATSKQQYEESKKAKEETGEGEVVYFKRRFYQDQLPMLKKQPETAWLGEAYASSLQAALIHLERAYKNCSANLKAGRAAGFPKFKRREARGSCEYPPKNRVTTRTHTHDGRVCTNFFLHIPKADQVRMAVHRIPPNAFAEIKTVTVSRTPTGAYYAAILIAEDMPNVEPLPVQIERAVGIDVGLKTYATLSTGEKIDGRADVKTLIKRLKREQRKLDRRQYEMENGKFVMQGKYKKRKWVVGEDGRKHPTKGCEEQRKKVAKLHEKITAIRKDYIEKVSHYIASDERFDVVCVEDLNTSGMLKNHRLAGSIAGAGFHTFKTRLGHKTKQRGKIMLECDRFAPTSKMCVCGTKNDKLTLKQREWTCSTCGATHDRDELAARNIVKFAFEKLKR